MVITKLQDTFKQKVKIGSLTTAFPTTIDVKDIEVEGLFRIDKVTASGGLFDIFRKSFRLSTLKIIHPIVTIEKGLIQAPLKDYSIPLLIPSFIPADLDLQKKSDNKVTTPNLNPMDISKGRFLFPRFYINNLIISDGIFNFVDRSVGGSGISIKIEHLNIKVENLNFASPHSEITSFQIEGKIPWEKGQEEGKIEAEGWLNLFKKDIQATLKIEGIDGIALYPYYSNWVDLEKARIEKAKLNFTSDIHGLNNDVTAACHLELAEVVRRPRSEGESQEKAEKITDVVLDIFKALNQGKIILDFTIKTKMDRPEFGFGNIKMAFEDKLTQARKTNGFKAQDFLMLPGKLIESTVKGATDVTKAVVVGTVSVGKELKNAVEDAFKREKKENK